MQFGVLPVLPAALAGQRGTAKMDRFVVVFDNFDVRPDEEVLAFAAEPQFIQRPSLSTDHSAEKPELATLVDGWVVGSIFCAFSTYVTVRHHDEFVLRQ